MKTVVSYILEYVCLAIFVTALVYIGGMLI